MTTSTQLPDLELEDGIDVLALAEGAEEEEEKRRKLLLLLLLLLMLLFCVGIVFVRYLLQPAPLPELLPLPVNVNPAPHYLFSIYGVESPVGVAISPQGDRIYVTETGGERLVKIFDQDGDPLGSFAPPRTGQFGDRSPVYLATDSTGRVFVTDRAQHAIFVYDQRRELPGHYPGARFDPERVPVQARGGVADWRFVCLQSVRSKRVLSACRL